MLAGIDHAQLPGQAQVHPDDAIVGIEAQHPLHQWQVLEGLLVVAEIGVDGEWHAATSQLRHERLPGGDRFDRHSLMAIVEQGLFDQIQLPHPAKQAWIVFVENRHLGQHLGGARQVGKGHRQHQLQIVGLKIQAVLCVAEVTLERGLKRHSRTVQRVGAGRLDRQALTDAIEIGEQHAALAQVVQQVREGQRRPAEGARMQMGVHHRQRQPLVAVIASTLPWNEVGQAERPLDRGLAGLGQVACGRPAAAGGGQGHQASGPKPRPRARRPGAVGPPGAAV